MMWITTVQSARERQWYNKSMSILTMTLAPLKPLKRLTRPAQSQGFMCTDRDLELMALLARFRFLSSDQLIRFCAGLTAREYAEQLHQTPWAFQVYLRRLHLMWAHGFLIRPERQRNDVVAFGNAPLIYGLSRMGAMLLKERGKHVDANLDFAAQQRVSRQWLVHTVETAEAVLAFDLSCRRIATVQLIDHDALRPYMPASRRAMPKPFVLRAALQKDRAGESDAVIPDRLIALETMQPPTETKDEIGEVHEQSDESPLRLLALEIDRGTVSGKKFTRRLQRYHAAWRADLHETQWGSKSLRVCTISPSWQRLENLIAAQQAAISGGSNLFCFSTPELIAERGALGSSWITGKGATVSLLGV
jgi:hypothetical protein